MIKFTMVSKLQFGFKEDVEWGTEEFDAMEAIKNGDVEISIPELSFLDEDGNEILDGDDQSEVIAAIMEAFKGVTGAK